MISHDIPEIDIEYDFDRLLEGCPTVKVAAAKKSQYQIEYEKQNTVGPDYDTINVQYLILWMELMNIANMKLPVRQLYDRFGYANFKRK